MWWFDEVDYWNRSWRLVCSWAVYWTDMCRRESWLLSWARLCPVSWCRSQGRSCGNIRLIWARCGNTSPAYQRSCTFYSTCQSFNLNRLISIKIVCGLWTFKFTTNGQYAPITAASVRLSVRSTSKLTIHLVGGTPPRSLFDHILDL